MTEEKNTKSYAYGLGRRKQSIAKVKMFFGGSGKFLINGKEFTDYVKIFEKQEVAKAPLRETGLINTFDIEVSVSGGGPAGQASAISLVCLEP
jgi:small subunit ribosomal protein S9